MRGWIAAAFVFAGLGIAAQARNSAEDTPQAMKHPVVPSHGSNLLGVFYLAGGAGPHPTAILFHGFPGYEQNLDLAQALRREGWNVLAMHYRGSWGVGGQFSFLHAAEDADAQVNFVFDPKNAAEYHIDASRVVVIGHSMGGFMAASAAAHNPKIAAAILISAWNIGAPRPSETGEAQALARDNNLAPLTGATAAGLAHEEFTHRDQLDMVRLAPAVAPRPVMLITATRDGSDQFATPMAAALKAAGDNRVETLHFDTDHPYSGKRLELIEGVESFLKEPQALL